MKDDTAMRGKGTLVGTLASYLIVCAEMDGAGIDLLPTSWMLILARLTSGCMRKQLFSIFVLDIEYA